MGRSCRQRLRSDTRGGTGKEDWLQGLQLLCSFERVFSRLPGRRQAQEIRWKRPMMGCNGLAPVATMLRHWLDASKGSEGPGGAKGAGSPPCSLQWALSKAKRTP